MITILCGECSNAPLIARPNRAFECLGCGHLIYPDHDLELDYDTTWAVRADGILGYVSKPAVCLEQLMYAVEEFLTADEVPNAEYAREIGQFNAADALNRYIDARRTGIAPPHLGYTRDQVQDAIDEGADMVLESISLGDMEEDVINLVVNGAMMCLEKPGATFKEMVEEQYSETVEEIRSWWGWDK